MRQRQTRMKKLKTMAARVLATAASLILAGALLTGCGAAQEKTTVRIGGLKGPTTLGLLSLQEKTTNGEAKEAYEFSMMTAADEILPLMIKGELDIALLPANVASVLYNKTNGGISVIDINTLGVLYMVSGDSSIDEITDLKDKKVGVQAASAAYSVLTDEEAQKALGDSFGELAQFGDYNAAFAELAAGALDAVAMDIGVAKYQLNSRGEGFVILDEHLNAEQYGVGFKLGNEELRDTVNESLMQLLEDGTFAELAEKYELSDMVCLTNEAETEAESETEAAE